MNYTKLSIRYEVFLCLRTFVTVKLTLVSFILYYRPGSFFWGGNRETSSWLQSNKPCQFVRCKMLLGSYLIEFINAKKVYNNAGFWVSLFILMRVCRLATLL